MKTHVNFTRLGNLLYYFASFFGFAPFCVRNNSLQAVGFLRKAYALILVFLSSLWTFSAYVQWQSKTVEIDSISQLVFLMNTILLVGYRCSTLLTLAFKSRRIVEIINQLTTITAGLKDLGIVDIWSQRKKSFYTKIIATNIVIHGMKIIQNVIFYDNTFDAVNLVSFLIGSSASSIHSHNAILIFVEALIYVSKVFESLNNKLLGIVQPNRCILSSHDQRDSSVFGAPPRRRIAARAAQGTIDEPQNTYLSVKDIETIKRSHRELCDLVESIISVFTVSLLFIIVAHFSKLLSSCYSMYTNLPVSRNDSNTTETMVPLIRTHVARVTIAILELFLIANACSSVSNVGNATKIVLHEAWNKFYPEELKKQFYSFSIQLLHKRVSVSAFGFFDLDYSCLYKISCAVVAYFVIMVQLAASKPDPDT